MAFDFQGFVTKHKPHPETVSFLMARAAEGLKPYYEIGVTEARLASIRSSHKYGGTVDFPGTEKEFRIPSPDVPDGIPISVYRPTSCDQLAAPSIVVYFHGGGNVLGCRETHATMCKTIARDASCVMVNVEYRLGPEHRFPANIDDAKCAVEWVSQNKALIGGTDKSPLGAAGDSAGGRIAAVVSHELAAILNFSVLIYPSVDFITKRASFAEFANGPVLSTPVVTWFKDNYISPDDYGTVRASPIMNSDFSRLPPTLIVVAELDPLRDGCYAYAEKIKAAGVHVEVLTMPGVIHAYWSLPAHFKENCQKSYAKAVEFIKAHSSSG